MKRQYDVVEYNAEDIRRALETMENRNVSDNDLELYLHKWFNKLDNGKFVYNDVLIEAYEKKFDNLPQDDLIFVSDDE